MRTYKLLYIYYLYSNFGLFLILFCFSIFFKILGILVYILFLSITVFVFYLQAKTLIISNESITLNYKRSKKTIIFGFQQIKSINVIYKDYYIYQIKAVEIQFNNNKNYKISCDGLYEEDEFEDGMFELHLFLKEKFKDTFLTEFDISKR